MTEGKHTPGPWEIEPGHSVVVISGGDGRRIGVVDRASYYQSYSEQDLIDARLIAAAPELLEALGNARTQIVILGGNVIEVDGKIVSDAIQAAVLQVIDDAIAKATGAS